MITTVEAANWQLASRQTAKCTVSSICPLVMAEWPTPASRGGVKFDNLCVKPWTSVLTPLIQRSMVKQETRRQWSRPPADADQSTGTHHCSVSGGSSKQIVSDCTRRAVGLQCSFHSAGHFHSAVAGVLLVLAMAHPWPYLSKFFEFIEVSGNTYRPRPNYEHEAHPH